jgi:hypothetical protein
MAFCGSGVDALSVARGAIQNECFVDVLNIIPHGVFLLVSLFIIVIWDNSLFGKEEVNTWVHFQGHDVRWISTIAMILAYAAEIVEGIISDSVDPDTANLHVYIPQCLGLVGTVISIVYYHHAEMWNSPRYLLLLLAYWTSAGFLKVLKAVSLYHNNLHEGLLRPWLTGIVILLYVLLLVIELNVFRIQVNISPPSPLTPLSKKRKSRTCL